MIVNHPPPLRRRPRGAGVVDGGAKIFQGSGPKRHESWIANWVYAQSTY